MLPNLTVIDNVILPAVLEPGNQEIDGNDDAQENDDAEKMPSGQTQVDDGLPDVIAAAVLMLVVGMVSVSGPRRISVSFVFRWICPLLVTAFAAPLREQF